MSSLEIPKWIGPVLTPIVLILLIAVVCFYYCYWKPRRERKKKANEANDKQEKKKTISPSAPGRHYIVESVKQQQCYPYDEEIYYGGYYDCEGYSLTGPYYIDYCPIPGNGLSLYTQYDCNPKLVYYPNAPYHAKSREMGCRGAWCKDVENTRKCRVKVKCPQGECIKCPDLPMITEGDSRPSLCEEEEEDEQKNSCNLEDRDILCACDDDDDVGGGGGGGDDDDHDENQEKLEAKGDSDSDNTSSCCRDSGYED